MATTNKVLGGVKPAGVTLTTLYTVPDATMATATMFICNQSGIQDDTFDIEILPSGQSDDDKWYIAKNSDIGKGTFMSATSFALNAGDSIKVLSHFGNCSFVITGLETV